MNSKQISFLSTCRRMSNFIKKFTNITSILPTFTETQTEFDGNLTLMEAYGNQQNMDISGLRTQKEDMKISTGEKVLDMSHRIEAFAKITGDVVLAKKAHLSDTSYLKSSDHDFMSTNNIVYELAESKMLELEVYGVTSITITTLKLYIENYRALVDAPKEGTTGRKQVTDQLAIMVDTQTGVLDKMDSLYELLKYSNPAIYAEYQDTRKIVYRSGSLSVKCEVTDAETSLPLGGAIIGFYLKGMLILEKTTSQTGGCTIKTFNNGTYTVTVTRLGYLTQSLVVNVLDVEMTSVKVKMMKESLNILKVQPV